MVCYAQILSNAALIVQHLSLAITMTVINSPHAQPSAIYFEKFMPKLTYENWVSIKYQTSGKTMKLVDHANK